MMARDYWDDSKVDATRSLFCHMKLRSRIWYWAYMRQNPARLLLDTDPSGRCLGRPLLPKVIRCSSLLVGSRVAGVSTSCQDNAIMWKKRLERLRSRDVQKEEYTKCA
uniref:Uncharacterized protein n=1 Tax=Ascaris lumbricoides TaxID=6252 RepID=A0A0M3HX33_ASCLU